MIMNAIRRFILMVSVVLICHTTQAQTSYTEIYPDLKVPISNERIDVKKYASKYQGSILDYSYTENDGTQVQVKSYKKGSNIEIFEKPPHPAIHIIYKEFYPNGNLKQKGVILPSQLEIGKWIQCDEKGNCEIIDYEEGEKRYDYNEILAYLEFRGYYNKQDENEWKCLFWYASESNTWGVRVNKNGHQYKMYTFNNSDDFFVEEFDLSPNVNSVEPTGTFIQEEE